MTQEQAEKLASEISEQFSHVETLVVQASDMRNAPRNWFIAVKRKNGLVEGLALHIHNQLEWQEALEALHILQTFEVQS